jgi:hypothetical protein
MHIHLKELATWLGIFRERKTGHLPLSVDFSFVFGKDPSLIARNSRED